MNICFFDITEVPCGCEGASLGGAERSSSLLAQELRHRGHNVEFYQFLPGHRHRFHIPLVSLFISSLHPGSYRTSGSEEMHFREFVKEHKIDVAVWQKMGFSVPFSFKNLPCRLIAVFRNTPRIGKQVYADQIIKKLKLRSRWVQQIVRSRPCSFLLWKFYESCHSRFFFYTCHYGNKFVLLSESFIPEFAPAKKFPHKVCAIPNIVSPTSEGVDLTAKKKELLWVARMDFNQKRPDFMLQIWQRLQDRFPDWSLRFVGDGEYLPKLKALAEELGVQRVSFEGFQAPAPYYRSAPIFCMTSTYEGFGRVLVEAQALGCVPVAFESYSSVHDIIEDGVNGYLVPPFDLDIYAEKLAQLMSNPTLCQRLAVNAQKSVGRFSSKTIGDRWEKLLQEIQKD